jgi:hypothetical protein
MDRGTTMDSPLEAADRAAGSQVTEAFSLLSDETRLSILLALWEAAEPFAETDAVPFSELYDRVDISDSGQFNYHLDKLVGQFVEKRTDGYRLRGTGRQIVRSVIAGAGIEEPSLDPTEIDGECSRCGAPIAVTYDDGWLHVVCTDCDGKWGSRHDVPDGALIGSECPPAALTDRTPEELWQANSISIYQAQKSAIEGVCDSCSGPMERSLDICRDHDPEGVCDDCGRSYAAIAQFSCPVCKNYHAAPPHALVKHHPAVVAFYYERGLSIQYGIGETEMKCASAQFKQHEQELVDTDPARVRVTVQYDGDTLRLTLDEELSVIDVTESA